MSECRVTGHLEQGGSDAGPWAVCEHCSARGIAALRDLLRAWVGLLGALGRRSGGGTEPVSSIRPGPSLLIRAEVYDLAADVFREVTTWEESFRAVHGWSRTSPETSGRSMQRAVDTLDRAWDLVLQTHGTIRRVGEILRLRDRAHAILRWDELVHRMPLPCPRCELATLIRRNGEEWSECEGCGFFLSATDYDTAVDAVLALHAPTLVRTPR